MRTLSPWLKRTCSRATQFLTVQVKKKAAKKATFEWRWLIFPIVGTSPYETTESPQLSARQRRQGSTSIHPLFITFTLISFPLPWWNRRRKVDNGIGGGGGGEGRGGSRLGFHRELSRGRERNSPKGEGGVGRAFRPKKGSRISGFLTSLSEHWTASGEIVHKCDFFTKKNCNLLGMP